LGQYAVLKSLHVISVVLFPATSSPQRKMLANVRAGIDGDWNESEYRRPSRGGRMSGAVATLALVIAAFLVVMKPA
jgi:hypothetical protein